MTFIEYAVRAVGLFYALGAVFLIRQMAVSDLLDRALSALEAKPQQDKHAVKRWLLGAGAALTGASGVAALLMSSWALPLFAANLVLQAGWLVWAAQAFPPEDAEDALGRRRTLNAAFFYATVTATVFALGWEGALRPSDELRSAGPVAVATLGYGVYLLRSLGVIAGRKEARRWRDDEAGGPDSEPDRREPSRVRFEVHPFRFPMVDADDGRLLNHFTYLDHDMASAIEDWHCDFAGFVAGAGEGAVDVFPLETLEQEHRAQAERFVEQLRSIYGAGNVEGPVYLPPESWGSDGDADGEGSGEVGRHVS